MHKAQTEPRTQTTQSTSKYRALEERTFRFAEHCREFVKKLPRTAPNAEYGKQLIRASSSPAANYIEANESLGRKDFVHKVRICRKETKEAGLWLRLSEPNASDEGARDLLLRESEELRKIFNAIVEKSISR